MLRSLQRTNGKCLNVPDRDQSLDLLHYAPLFSSGSVDHFVVRQTEFWPLVYLQFWRTFWVLYLIKTNSKAKKK